MVRTACSSTASVVSCKRRWPLNCINPSDIRWGKGEKACKEKPQWQIERGKSFASNPATRASITVFAILAQIVTAAAQGPAPKPGLAFDAVRDAIAPMLNGIALPFYVVGALWQYLMDNPPASTIVAAILGSSVAVISIRKQREIARLKETFTALDRNNWDKDLIDARVSFGKLKKVAKEGGKSVAEYSNPKSEEEIKQANQLYSILNDYENMAIAIRMDILDEVYAYRYMRGLVIDDWSDLSPLVTSLRHDKGAPLIYIEFEGLAEAWQQDRSYRTNKLMNKVRRKISIH